MSDTIPKMPNDWFPDEVIVIGKNRHDGKQYELAFAISKESFDHIEHMIKPSLNGLRQALWQARFMSEEDKIRYKLKETA